MLSVATAPFVEYFAQNMLEENIAITYLARGASLGVKSQDLAAGQFQIQHLSQAPLKFHVSVS